PDAAPAVLPDVSAHASFWPTLLAMLALVGFHFYVQAPHPGPGPAPEVWLDAGTAQAGRILQGQWWRLVTALTLHADAAHVLGNAVFGGLFAGLLCRRVGSGLGWLLILLAGAAGNGCNALVAAPWHDSLGFSTALFGAAGALSGLNLRRGSLSRAAAPLAAALGILAMLGAGGEDPGLIDLGAHGFGLAAGLGLGAGAGFVLRRRGLPGRAADAVLGLLALGMVVGCWGLALRALPA
ncbi:MAG: rhomboid family intramembrane serine protease, partial [Desulfovibrionaceae bacterium]